MIGRSFQTRSLEFSPYFVELTINFNCLCYCDSDGVLIACGLSEFMPAPIRQYLKPIIEILAGIPSVIFGYFALLVVTPALQVLMPELPSFSLLSAGITMSFMILPLIVSLSEDALQAVSANSQRGFLRSGSNPT